MILTKYLEFKESETCKMCGSQQCDSSPEMMQNCEKYRRFVECDEIVGNLKPRVISMISKGNSVYEFKQAGQRISKDEYYLGIAEAVLKRSTCLRRKYGVVIVQNDVIVATGYNGSPRGMANCCDLGYCERERQNVPKGQRYELCVAIHAEDNAITAAGRERCLGAILYICGQEPDGSYANPAPCLMCNRKIVNVGIAKVIGRTKDGEIKELPIVLS